MVAQKKDAAQPARPADTKADTKPEKPERRPAFVLNPREG